MTPGELADKLEQVPPGFGWQAMIRLLRWQQNKGKRLLNVGYYGESAFRDYHRRIPNTPAAREAQARLARLSAGVLEKLP